MAKNYYQILGVDCSASFSEIRDAYLLRMKVVHPDRFDPKTQYDEWQQANEMLKDFNEAYAVLKDEYLRRNYDESLKAEQTSKQGQQNYRENSKNNKNASYQDPSFIKLGKLIAGNSHFKDLPKSATEALLQRQNENIKDQFKYKLAGNLRAKLGVLAVLLWCIVILYNAFSGKYRWGSETWIWYILFSCAALFVFTKSTSFIRKWNTSTLKCYIYVTRLYIIKTWLDSVYYYPLWTLKDINVTHNYRNGIHVSSDTKLTFDLSEENISFSSKEYAENFVKCINLYNKIIFDKKIENNWEYFFYNDDFREVEKTAEESYDNRPYTVFSLSIGGLLLFSTLSLAFLYNSNNQYYIQKYQPPSSTIPEYNKYTPPTPKTSPQDRKDKTFESDSTYRPTPTAQHDKLQSPNTLSLTPQTFPKHGTVNKISKKKNIAPLEIKTSHLDNYYFVKLVDYKSKAEVMHIYLHPGKPFKSNIPLGLYMIKYATGSTWYGNKNRFGPETKYSMALERFDFLIEGNEAKGYSIELIMQQHGNLKTISISPEDF